MTDFTSESGVVTPTSEAFQTILTTAMEMNRRLEMTLTELQIENQDLKEKLAMLQGLLQETQTANDRLEEEVLAARQNARDTEVLCGTVEDNFFESKGHWAGAYQDSIRNKQRADRLHHALTLAIKQIHWFTSGGRMRRILQGVLDATEDKRKAPKTRK